MNYLTKEWYKLCSQTDLHFDFTVLEDAELRDPSTYERLLQAKLDTYLAQQEELHNTDPRDTGHSAFSFLMEPLLSMGGHNNSSGEVSPEDYQVIEPSAEERKVQEGAIKAFEERGPFNPALAREEFLEIIANKQNTLREDYPAEILEQVADAKIFALGYCNSKIYEALQKASEENQNKVDLTLHALQDAQEQQTIPEPILEHFGSHDSVVTTAKFEPGDEHSAPSHDFVITLDPTAGFSPITTYRFKNAKIIKMDGPLEGAWWLYDELYSREGGVLEVHVLLAKDADLLDLILECSDIAFEFVSEDLRTS